MENLEFIKENEEHIIWDFCLEEEFKNRQVGCSFVIDVNDQKPQLSLYIMKKRLSKSETLAQQPPREMLVRAVEETGASLQRDCLYDINDEIRQWIKENLLK